MIGVSAARNRPRVYRSASAIYGALLATAALAGAIAIAVVPGRGEIVGYIFAPIALAFAWRAWRWGVHIETDGVKVVGSFVSKRVTWEEIDHFDVRPWQRYPYQGHVVLKNGRPIPIFGISAGRPESERHRRQAQEPIDRLNEALEQWRATHPRAA